MNTPDRPEDASAIDCGDGIEIRRSGGLHVVYRDGRYVDAYRTAMDAIRAVDAIKASN